MKRRVFALAGLVMAAGLAPSEPDARARWSSWRERVATAGPVDQRGHGLGAAATQFGAGNDGAIVQRGRDSTAVLRQDGNVNTGAVYQRGSGNTGALIQNGDHNNGCLLQAGNNLDGTMVQSGGENRAVAQTNAGVREYHGIACNLIAGARFR